MLIRTQNRQTLVNMDRITVLDAAMVYKEKDADARIFAFSMSDTDYDEGCELGWYPTMSDAKKVLDMIEDAYKKDRHFLPVTVDAGAANITQFALIEPQVFQMPKYEEVQDV